MNTTPTRPTNPAQNNRPAPGGGGGGGGGRGRQPLQQPDAHKINHRITAREVRLIGDDGEQYGVVPLKEALLKAEDQGFDLVEVSPNAKPPVCKIMDYGKFKYREQKKEAEAKKKRTETVVKELRLRYRTETGDLETKLNQARKFIVEGDKVKFSMRFKGREIMYVNLGEEKFNQIIERLSDIAVVDERSPVNGRQTYIVLAPSKGGASQPQKVAVKVPGSKPVVVTRSSMNKTDGGEALSEKLQNAIGADRQNKLEDEDQINEDGE